jgi:hypothetical protein
LQKPLAQKGKSRDVRHKVYEQRCGLLWKNGGYPCCGRDWPNCGLFRLFSEDFLGFLHQSTFAKLSIILVRFASAILESLSFSVYVFEWRIVKKGCA